jgi:hypothetical protein
LPQEGLVRVAPAPDQIGDADAVGRRRALRQQAEPARDLAEISLPSSTTRPAAGDSSRDSARSRVDLPQAFGPTMTVKDPSGMASDRPVEIVRSS